MKRGSLKKWQFSRVLQLHSSSHNNQRRWWFSEIALYYSWEKRSYSIEKPVENNPLLMILECLGWGRLLFSVKYLFEHREGFFTVTTWDFLFKCKDWMSQKPETIQSLRSHTSKDIIPNVCWQTLGIGELIVILLATLFHINNIWFERFWIPKTK